jgi:hypothetical protein
MLLVEVNAPQKGNTLNIQPALKLICIGIITALLGACSGQGIFINTIHGSGNVVSESRDVSGFNKIEFGSQGDVTVTYGDTESLTIEAEDNLLPYLRTWVENGRLVIRTEPYTVNLDETRPIHINVVVTSLDEVLLSGSGNVDVEGVNGAQFAANLFGSGNLTLTGEAETLNADLRGSGIIDANALTADTATASVPGSGTIIVNAADSLNATINGSGTVEYLGSPDLTQRISGSGEIKRHV